MGKCYSHVNWEQFKTGVHNSANTMLSNNSAVKPKLQKAWPQNPGGEIRVHQISLLSAHGLS